MTAEPKPFVPKMPTVRELQARIDVLAAEVAVLQRERERSDALVDTMRLLLVQVDPACAITAGIQDRLATLYLTRRMLLNAIQAWKGPL